mgnify:CR=1 FL=1
MVTHRSIAQLALWAALLCAAQAPTAPPKRVISTAPSITETLFALGLGDRVVGVTTFCRYPPEAARKPKIGNYLRPDLEAIVALRPDLVIAERSMVRQALSLPGLKLRLLEVDDSTIDGVLRSIQTMGDAMGEGAKAQALAGSIKDQLSLTRRSTVNLPRKKVLFVVGRTPGRVEDLIAAGSGSYLDELVRIAGGENIFAGAAVSYAKINLEEVLARDPDVVIDMGEMARTANVTEQQKREVVRLWQRYPSLKAVRQKRVFAVASDIFVVPGPRLAEAAREIARLVHPEAFP